MTQIDEFISRYRKEYDFYDQACRLAAQLIEQSIRSAGVRAMVTSRAKSPARLEEKVRQRNFEKHYVSVDDIHQDIVDLAGVRISLYFPAERSQVGKMIHQAFLVEDKEKEFRLVLIQATRSASLVIGPHITECAFVIVP
ncbi:MAG: hypothetical protein WDO24_03455 [Pseudomonadota bacterium]